MILEKVNTTALGLAAELVVGSEQAARIVAVYQVIDRAHHAAYHAGLDEGQQNADKASSDAFDQGWLYGEAYGKEKGAQFSDEEYDSGYLDGVDDARARPDRADAVVGAIVAEAAAHALNGELEAEDVEAFDQVTDGDAKVNASPEGVEWRFVPYAGPMYDYDNVRDSGDEQS